MERGPPVPARNPNRRRAEGAWQLAAARSAACCLGALTLVTAAGCGGSEPVSGAPAPPTPTVEVVTVEPQELRNVVEIPGQLESEHSVWVRAEIEGVIASIGFEEGLKIERGDVLFRLRDHEERARLRETEAQLALATEVHQRTQQLAHQNVSSAAQLDRAAAELQVARSRVELARVYLERATIRAPFSGMLGARAVSLGERVREETRLVKLDAVDRLQLVFSLPESAVGIVHPGAPVRIRVAPYPGETFSGEVFFVSPTLDPQGRRIVLKAWIPNPDGRLRAGLFATIEAELERRDDALLIPESAVVRDLDGVYVWRLAADDVADRVPIEIGLRVDGKVEVREGLVPGDVIVTAGTLKLAPGTRVQRDLAPASRARSASHSRSASHTRKGGETKPGS